MEKNEKNIFLLFIANQVFCSVDLIISSQENRSVDILGPHYVGAGFFCQLNKVLEPLIHFEAEGISSVYIDWTSPNYSYKDGYTNENGWDLFFEKIPTTEFGTIRSKNLSRPLS